MVLNVDRATFSRQFSLRRILLAALLAQAAVHIYLSGHFLRETYQAASTIGQPWTLALAGSVALLISLAVSAKLWSHAGADCFAASALAHIAALTLFHYLIALASGRLFRPATVLFLTLSLSLGAVRRFWRPAPSAGPSPMEPPFGAWDMASVFVLATLLVPVVFPYIYADAERIWGCRAFALNQNPSLAALAACAQPGFKSVGPTYPPAWAILLWLGIRDPVFQGRLLAWTLLPLFALFFRARLARLDASLAPPALLFLLLTGRVWMGAGTWYADVPLMIFLVTGSLLALGLPRAAREDPLPGGDLMAGTLCLGMAVLMRPDGFYYFAVVAVGVAWFRFRRKSGFPIWPFLAAAVTALSWTLFRPAPLRIAPHYMHPNALWREAGTTTGKALWNILIVFLTGWQGQWLSHWGFGVVFYLLAGLLVWRRRRAAPAGEDAIFFGLVSLGLISAVIFCFAAMPFLGDPTVCTTGMDYTTSYLTFIKTGLGRVTVHLYPFFILWAVATVKEGADPN